MMMETKMRMSRATEKEVGEEKRRRRRMRRKRKDGNKEKW